MLFILPHHNIFNTDKTLTVSSLLSLACRHVKVESAGGIVIHVTIAVCFKSNSRAGRLASYALD